MPTTKTKPILLQPAWKLPLNIKAVISTRSNEFNLATHVNDDPDNVIANRQQLRNYLPSEPFWLQQTHSDRVVKADLSQSTTPDADASYTTQKGVVCAVMTADCLPILLTNISGDFVAAIHAGWRGLNDNIIIKTIQELSHFNPKEMLAFIGPAIDQECFEIGAEVRESFLLNDINTAQFFSLSKNEGKYMANLRGIAEYKLLQAGLPSQNITNPAICTKCNHNWFFSYRENSNTGRMASLIWKI
jgi:YfiH family protein